MKLIYGPIFPFFLRYLTIKYYIDMVLLNTLQYKDTAHISDFISLKQIPYANYNNKYNRGYFAVKVYHKYL